MPSSQATLKRASSVKVLALFDDTPLSPLPIGSPFSPTDSTNAKKKSIDRRSQGSASPNPILPAASGPPVGDDGNLEPQGSNPTFSSPKKSKRASTLVGPEKPSSAAEKIYSKSDHDASSNKLVKSTEIRASIRTMTYDDHQEYIQRMMQSISGTAAFSKNVGVSNRTSLWGGNEEWMDSWAPTSASDSTYEPGSQPRLKQLDDDDLDKSGRLKHGVKEESSRKPSSKDVSVNDEIELQKQSSRPPFSSSREEDAEQYQGPLPQNDRRNRPDPHLSRPPSGSSRNLTKNMQSGRSSTRESYKEVGNRDRRQSTASSGSMKKAQSERNLMSLAEEVDLDHTGDHNDWNGRHPSDASTHMKRPTSERNLMSLSQESSRDSIRECNPRDSNQHRRSSSRHQAERNLMTFAEETDRDRDRARDYNHRYRRSESYTQTTSSRSDRHLMSGSQNSERDRGRDHNPRDYRNQRASLSPKKRPQSERNFMSLTERGDRDRSRDHQRSRRSESSKSSENWMSMSEHYDSKGPRDNNLRDYEHRSASLSPMKRPKSSRILRSLNEESSHDLGRNDFDHDRRYESKSRTQSIGRNRTRDTEQRDQRHRSSSSALEGTGNMTILSEERDRYNRREKDQSRRYSTSTPRDKGARSDRISMPLPEKGERDHSRYRDDKYDQSRAAFDYDKNGTSRDERERRHRFSSSIMDQNSTLVSARSDHRDYRHSRTAESMSYSSERRRSSKSPSSHRNRSRSRNSRHRSSSHDSRRRQADDDKDRISERRLPNGASGWQEGSSSRAHDSSSVPTSRSSKSQSRSSSVDRRHRHSTSSSSPRRASSTFSRRSSMPVEFPVTHLEISSEAVDKHSRSEERSESKSPGSIDSRGNRSSRRYSRHRSSSSHDSESGRRSSKSPRTKSSDRKIGRDSKDWKALRDMALSSSASRDGVSQSAPLQVASWHGTSKSRPRRGGKKSELLASSVVSFPEVDKLNEDESRRHESKKDKKDRRKSSKSQERRGKVENPERRRSNSDGSASRGPSRRRQREMDKAAIVVQKWARRFMARLERRRLRDVAAAEVVSPFETFRRRLKNDAAYNAMASKAALPIQQLIRSYQAKVELHRLKEERLREVVTACVLVQRIVRGHLAKLARERAKLKRKQELQQALARYEPERAKYTEYLMEKKKIQSEISRDISICESKIQQVKDEYSRELKKLEDSKEVQKRIWGEAIKKRLDLELAKKEAERVAKEQEDLANVDSVDPAQEIAELEVEIAEMKNWLQNTEAKVAAKNDERNELERANVEVEKMFHELNDFAKAKVAENKELSSQQLMLTKILLPKAVKNAETATQEIHKEIRSKLQLRRTIYRVFEEVKSRESHDQSLCSEVELAIRQCERELSQDLLEGNKVLELLVGDMEALFEIEALRVHELGECPHVPVSATGWDAIAKGVLSNMGKKKKFSLDDLSQD